MPEVAYVLVMNDCVVGVFTTSRGAEKVMLGEMERLRRAGVRNNVYFSVSGHFPNSLAGYFQRSTAVYTAEGASFHGFEGREGVLQECLTTMSS